MILFDSGGPFDGLMSCADAAALWGIDQSTIRKAIASGKLEEGKDCMKFGKQWVVTAKAMHDLTGSWVPWSRYKSDEYKRRMDQATQ